MLFEILSELRDVETFASGSGIRELPRLRKLYGDGFWRKRKGITEIPRFISLSCIGMKLAGLVKKSSKLNTLLSNLVMSKHTFAICIKNVDYEVSLELRKLYEVLPDPKGEALGMMRIVDESGEDYLYPKAFFIPLSLPTVVEEQVLLAA